MSISLRLFIYASSTSIMASALEVEKSNKKRLVMNFVNVTVPQKGEYRVSVIYDCGKILKDDRHTLDIGLHQIPIPQISQPATLTIDGFSTCFKRRVTCS